MGEGPVNIFMRSSSIAIPQAATLAAAAAAAAAATAAAVAAGRTDKLGKRDFPFPLPSHSHKCVSVKRGPGVGVGDPFSSFLPICSFSPSPLTSPFPSFLSSPSSPPKRCPLSPPPPVAFTVPPPPSWPVGRNMAAFLFPFLFGFSAKAERCWEREEERGGEKEGGGRHFS